MKKSIKGALLSGLVFPGVGQIFLKCYFKGIALILAITAALIVIIVKGEQIAAGVMEQIQAQGGAIDTKTISDIVSHAATTADTLIIKGAFFFIILCWAVSIIDAFKIGRKIDKQKDKSDTV